ncbi:tol-pal system-associated acyl-CoA thioesterase [Thalassotalea aquiviva]|uniref:tol-pal system-associated acyl-CoA thioesterase n=1 Tax=Thalassotalea aquiviva TaxID=3242415 RepID=UPI00352B275B
MPEQTQQFTYSLRVFYEDTDAGGIVYYANYLKFAERARTEWLRELGINQSYFLEQNLAFVVRNVEMDNKASAKLDDLLTIKTSITSLKKASLVFNQQIFNQHSQLLCEVKVLIASVNLQAGKPCAIPKTILGALNSAR